jgi:hypothetical protein
MKIISLIFLLTFNLQADVFHEYNEKGEGIKINNKNQLTFQSGKAKKLNLPSDLKIERVLFQDRFVFIQTRDQKFHFINLDNLELKDFPGTIKGDISVIRKLQDSFLIGDSKGNLIQAILTKDENIFSVNSKFVPGVFAEGISEIIVSKDEKMFYVQSEKKQIKTVGFKYTSYLPNDHETPNMIGYIKDPNPPSGELTTMGFKSESIVNEELIKTQTNNFNARFVSPYQKSGAFFLGTEQNAKLLAQFNGFSEISINPEFNFIYYTSPNELRVLDFEALISGNKNVTIDKLIKQGRYDFIKVSGDKIITGSANSSEVFVFDLKNLENPLEIKGQSPSRGFINIENNIGIIRENGQVDILVLKKNPAIIENFKIDLLPARNSEVKQVGNFIQYIDLEGNQRTFKVPRNCNMHL